MSTGYTRFCRAMAPRFCAGYGRRAEAADLRRFFYRAIAASRVELSAGGAMKNHEEGGAMGRPSPRSLLLAHPGAKFFRGQRGLGTPRENDPCAGTPGENFSFGFSSLAEGVRSGPQQSRGAPFWGAAGAYPLTARTAAEPCAREEKILYSMTADLYHQEGRNDE